MKFFLLNCFLLPLCAGVLSAAELSVPLCPGTPIGKGEIALQADSLILTTRPDASSHWQGVALPAPADVSKYEAFRFSVRNLSDRAAKFECELVTHQPALFAHQVADAVMLAPGERRRVILPYPVFVNSDPDSPFGLQRPFDRTKHKRSLPDGKLSEIRFYTYRSTRMERFEIGDLKFVSRFEERDRLQPVSPAEKFYPCIDRFGQYRHGEWPGKLHDESEFLLRRREEAADLALYPEVAGINRFGGWAAGPALEKRGRFYPIKRNGRWWLVDPAGNLFWSFGLNCVNNRIEFGLDLHENCFEALPEASSPFFSVYRNPIGFYRARGFAEVKVVDFLRWNQFRKYGSGYEAIFVQLAPRRLRSWGFNTIGNWSMSRIYDTGTLPYTATIESRSPLIAGDKGYWQNFPDVFDPAFARSIEKSLIAQQRRIDDPLCIGFFFGNEISWGDGTSLARGVVRSPAAQAAKKAFVKHLREKYGSIAKLNEAWGRSHADFSSLLQSRDEPHTPESLEDLREFDRMLVRRYFETARTIQKRLAPRKLLLGCRFISDNLARPDLIVEAAKFLDVVSFNIYWKSLDAFALPEGLDVPVLIGEWHIGCSSYGPPHHGIRGESTQKERAAACLNYLKSARRNPFIVGAHYFMYCDEPALGRPQDGENMQIGFVDVTDTPYPDMVNCSRRFAERLYECRESEETLPAETGSGME